MVDKNILLQKLNPYIGNMTILKYDQGTQDIISELLKSHQEQAPEYDKIYKYFVGRSLRETAKNIFDYLKKNVDYKIEPASKQSLKSAASIVAQGYGDCKQFSQFAGGILSAIDRNKEKIDWCYRFASYNDKKMIQHVFVVLKDKNGREIWIDPVINKFDYHKAYNFKQDKKPNMALYKISGMDQVGKIQLKKLNLQKVASAVKTGAKIVKTGVKIAKSTTPQGAALTLGKGLLKKVVQKGALKTVAKKAAGNLLKKGGIQNAVKSAAAKAKTGGLKKIVVKVANVASRNAFLALIKANKNGIATKMGASLSSIDPKIKIIWEKLGGKYSVLKSTILQGSRNQISGIDHTCDCGIGAIDVSKVYVASLPVINKFSDVLKSVGVDVDSLLKKGSQEVVDQVNEKLAVDQNNQLVDNPNTPSSEVSQAPILEPNQSGENTEQVETSVSAKGDTAVVDLSSGSGDTMDYKKFIIPAVALAAIYFISKKK